MAQIRASHTHGQVSIHLDQATRCHRREPPDGHYRLVAREQNREDRQILFQLDTSVLGDMVEKPALALNDHRRILDRKSSVVTFQSLSNKIRLDKGDRRFVQFWAGTCLAHRGCS